MSGTQNHNNSHGLEHGLPPRPPTASTPLWAHLLQPSGRSPSTLSDLSAVAPSLKPLDKNATSMRILLHDTQANFEKFSVHTGKLLDGIKETRNELKETQTLFERDREAMIGDIIDLVNRAQKEIQKSIGTPAQSPSVESFFKDVNHKFNVVEQCLGAIQAFNHTHAQALQTQIQAVQNLLDKQGDILSAVLPLLPLVQSIPLHVEAAKNSIHETLTKSLSSWNPTVNVPRPLTTTVPLEPDLSERVGKRKRSNSRFSTSSSSPFQPTRMPSPKKIRSDSSPLRPISHPLKSASNRDVHRKDLISHNKASGNRDLSTQNETTASPVYGLSMTTSSSSPRTLTTRTSVVTPRRPLLDLLMPPLHNSIPRSSSVSHTKSARMSRSSTSVKGLPSMKLPGMTPSASRPPRILRVQTSFSENKRSLTEHTVNDPKPSNEDQPRPRQTPSKKSSAQDEIKSTASHFPSKNGTTVVDLSIRDMPYDSDKIPAPDFTQRPLFSAYSLDRPEVTSKQAIPDTTQMEKKLPAALAILGKANQRNTPPLREGRRFIPLVDSEDEDED